MGGNARLRQVAPQDNPYQSPWSLTTKVMRVMFIMVWVLTCRFTPNPLNRWRLFILRLFGTKISGRPYVAPSARISTPWNVTLEDRAAIGPGAEVYALGEIILRERSTVSQYCYLCTGSHDISQVELPLTVGTVEIGVDALLFAQVFVAPGVKIGDGAVIGSRSVVTKDMPAWKICVGNPCKPIKDREFPRAPGQASATD